VSKTEFVDGVLGEWVAEDRLHPAVNVAGRKWRLPDGRTGVVANHGALPPPNEPGVQWFFPEMKADKRPLA
jgi:hypothetical protein